MGRKRLDADFNRDVPWRKRARDKLKSREIPGRGRRRIRERISQELNEESYRRAFKSLGVKEKGRQREIKGKLETAKYEAVKSWIANISDDDARDLARSVTLRKISTGERPKARALFSESQKRKGRYYRLDPDTGKPYGRSVGRATVNRSLAAKAYWARVRAIARAFDVPVSRARKLDRKLLDVPDWKRKQVYERIMREEMKKWKKRS